MDGGAATVAASAVRTGCFHCGEALPDDARVALAVGGRERDFCCAGCAAAASWIESAGLGAYYRMREEGSGARVEDAADVALFRRQALIERLARPLDDGRLELAVRIDGMQCAACSWLLQRVAEEQPELELDQLDGLSGRAVLRFKPGSAAPAALAQRLAALGYRLQPRGGAADQGARMKARRQRLLRVAVAGLGTMQAMMFAWPLYDAADMPLATRDFLRWIALLVTTPVVIWSAWPFFSGAWREIGLRRLGMDTPIALAIALAFGGSVVATIAGAEAVYFDSVAMFVFFLLVGRSIEVGLRERVAARLAGLAEQLPASVRRRAADGTVEQVGLIELLPGDHILLRPGDTVPVDGRLHGRGAQVSEAFLSGESRALPRRPGERVLAGSGVLDHEIELEVEAVGDSTTLGELERLVAQAARGRAQWTALADRAAQAFALVVIVAAIATILLWSASSAEAALSASVAVLAAACPCALSLALPTALSAATRALAGRHVLMVRAGGLERLATVDHVVFDKTGTLTEDRIELEIDWLPAGGDAARARAVAAALERLSRHPLARACQGWDCGLAVAEAREIEGEGVEGVVDGVLHRLGRATHAGVDPAAVAAGLQGGEGGLWLSAAGRPLAHFRVRQQLRADAASTVAQLRQRGFRISLLSGDHAAAVAEVAASLGIDDHAAELRPDDKLRRLQALREAGARVLMVGDGLNDAPVLAAAHASLALAHGADLARQQADGVVAGAGLGGVADALALAARTRRVVQQNLVWAAAYNLLAVPAAAFGLVGPWVAALGMSLSSLLVIANGMRLLRQRGGQRAGTGVPAAWQATAEAR